MTDNIARPISIIFIVEQKLEKEPSDWKTANVMLVFKKKELGNY